MKDLLERNAEDLNILKRAIPILKLGKVKTIGKRKKLEEIGKIKRKNKQNQKKS